MDRRESLCESAVLEHNTISEDEVAAAAELSRSLLRAAENEAAIESVELSVLRRRAALAPPPAAGKIRAPAVPDARLFRHGMLGYATILAVLKCKPRTALGVGAAMSIREKSPRLILRQLHRLGLVHITGWRRAANKGPHSPVWSVGAGADVAPPVTFDGLTSTNKLKGAPPLGVEAITFAQVIRELGEPVSAQSLRHSVGITEKTVYRLIAHMRNLKLIYIASWDSTVAVVPVPLYTLGARHDAERPKPQSREEVLRRGYDRLRGLNQMRKLIHRTATRFDAVAA